MTWKDWQVDCNVCPAEYTPKAREEPQNCFQCGSGKIDVEKLSRSVYDGV